MYIYLKTLTISYSLSMKLLTYSCIIYWYNFCTAGCGEVTIFL